jgi:hypothetical protein
VAVTDFAGLKKQPGKLSASHNGRKMRIDFWGFAFCEFIFKRGIKRLGLPKKKMLLVFLSEKNERSEG